MNMGLPKVLDQHLPRHWKQQGLSWGWTMVIWLAYILSEDDHRKVKDWHAIEQTLNDRSTTVYGLSAEVIRCGATTASVDHEGVSGGLVQCGHSKDDPSRPQIKLTTASLDPFGAAAGH